MLMSDICKVGEVDFQSESLVVGTDLRLSIFFTIDSPEGSQDS